MGVRSNILLLRFISRTTHTQGTLEAIPRSKSSILSSLIAIADLDMVTVRRKLHLHLRGRHWHQPDFEARLLLRLDFQCGLHVEGFDYSLLLSILVLAEIFQRCLRDSPAHIFFVIKLSSIFSFLLP